MKRGIITGNPDEQTPNKKQKMNAIIVDDFELKPELNEYNFENPYLATDAKAPKENKLINNFTPALIETSNLQQSTSFETKERPFSLQSLSIEERTNKVYEFICKYAKTNNAFPLINEITNKTGLPAEMYLVFLKEDGRIITRGKRLFEISEYKATYKLKLPKKLENESHRIYDYIKEKHDKKSKNIPTIRQIGEALGLSYGMVHTCLEIFCKKGYLAKIGNKIKNGGNIYTLQIETDAEPSLKTADVIGQNNANKEVNFSERYLLADKKHITDTYNFVLGYVKKNLVFPTHKQIEEGLRLNPSRISYCLANLIKEGKIKHAKSSRSFQLIMPSDSIKPVTTQLNRNFEAPQFVDTILQAPGHFTCAAKNISIETATAIDDKKELVYPIPVLSQISEQTATFLPYKNSTQIKPKCSNIADKCINEAKNTIYKFIEEYINDKKVFPSHNVIKRKTSLNPEKYLEYLVTDGLIIKNNKNEYALASFNKKRLDN